MVIAIPDYATARHRSQWAADGITITLAVYEGFWGARANYSDPRRWLVIDRRDGNCRARKVFTFRGKRLDLADSDYKSMVADVAAWAKPV